MRLNQFIKELFRGCLIGVLIFISFLGYYYLTDEPRFDAIIDNVWQEFFQNLIFTGILYMLNMFWFYFLLRKFEGNIYTPQRLTMGVIGNIILSCIGVFTARLIILTSLYERSLRQVLVSQKVDEYLQPILISLGIAVIFYSLWYYKYRQENKVKEQKIIAGTASAKFDALKNQLDPHFLFNSLNVLTSLIDEDPNQAQKFTTSLSKVYRYVLEQKNKDLISVDEELQFAKTYVRLLKMRFEDSIVFDIPEESTDPDAKIIPLSLQLLLENAVKHNVVTSDRPLHIKVFEENDMLVVSNNLQEKQVVKKSSGVGLQNIKQRYAILTDRQVSISKSTADFSVQLPMLTKHVSVMEKQQVYIDDKLYKKAKARVEKIKGFYGNLIAYCIVIPFLAFLNYQTSPSFPWAIFPMLGWGFGVVAHGMEAFGYNPLWGKKWEERRIKKYMEDDRF